MNAYKYLMIPFIAVILAQILKFVIDLIVTKKANWGRLFNGNGGMPSSHTSLTCSLAAAIGIGEGITSPFFAIAVVLAVVVAYDSMGLRMESGKQAQAINILMEKTFEKNPERAVKKLKEQLGHKPLEVLMGILFGTLVAFIIMGL